MTGGSPISYGELTARDRLAQRAGSLAWLCVLAVPVLVPLVNANPTIFGIGRYPLTVDQIELPRTIVLVALAWLGLAAWGVSQWARPMGVRWSREWWLLLGFLLLAGLSAVTSQYPRIVYTGRWFQYEGLLTLCAYAAASFVAAQSATPDRVSWLVRLGMITGVVLSLYGIAQALGMDAANWLSLSWPGGRAFATWNNPDFFGGYLLFPLAFSIGVAAGDTNRRWRIAGVLALVAVSFALVMTLTRGAWLAALLTGGLTLIGLGRRGFPWKRTLLIALVVFVLAAGAAFAATDGKLVTRALNTFRPGDDGVGGRIDIWRTTVPYAFDRPLLGTGPDTYAATMLRHLAGRPVSVPDDPHNIALYMLVTVGVPAALLFVGFIGSVLFRSARTALSDQPGFASIAMAALWSAAVAYSAYLMLTVSITGSIAMLFVCLGILSATVSPRVHVGPAPAALALVVGALMLMVSLFLGARGLAADHAYLNARNAARAGGDRVTPAEKAVRLNPLNDRYAEELERARNRQ
jgi:O-antigen ligase